MIIRALDMPEEKRNEYRKRGNAGVEAALKFMDAWSSKAADLASDVGTAVRPMRQYGGYFLTSLDRLPNPHPDLFLREAGGVLKRTPSAPVAPCLGRRVRSNESRSPSAGFQEASGEFDWRSEYPADEHNLLRTRVQSIDAKKVRSLRFCLQA